MRILVHDYSGHPFQVELSRELSRRGHDVTHSYCDAYTSGKGHLTAEPGETIRFDPIGVGEVIAKMSFGKRLLQELRLGVELVRQVRRIRPDVVMASNVPIPTLVILAFVPAAARDPVGAVAPGRAGRRDPVLRGQQAVPVLRASSPRSSAPPRSGAPAERRRWW